MSVETNPYGLDRHDPDIDIGMLDEALQSLETPPSNMKETAGSIGRLAVALETTHISPAFARVYGALSLNIHRAMEDGRFNRPEDIDHTSGRFAWFWYRNLVPYRDFVQNGDPRLLDDVEEPWRLPLFHPIMRDPSVPDYLKFWPGMTTHITARDLLASLMHSRPTDAYRDDFLSGVNGEIKKTMDQLAPELIPGHSLARAGLKPVIRGMIAYDRWNVWKNYEDYRGAVPVTDLEEEREKRRGAKTALERKYDELDELAIRRNKVTVVMGRAVNPFVVATAKLPDPLRDRAAA